ncbi:MAG: helix-turn-helix domain-containing protein [Thiohalomonadales bacterium]
MDLYALADKSIEKELGQRFKALRLSKNTTQKELAHATTLSLNSIKSLELGRCKLSTIIAVLREFNSLDQLDNFIPEISISPMQIAKMQGHIRQRASGEYAKPQKKEESDW